MQYTSHLGVLWHRHPSAEAPQSHVAEQSGQRYQQKLAGLTCLDLGSGDYSLMLTRQHIPRDHFQGYKTRHTAPGCVSLSLVPTFGATLQNQLFGTLDHPTGVMQNPFPMDFPSLGR